MAPKRSAKSREGMAQPTLSFQHRKPGSTAKKASLSSIKTTSLSSVDEATSKNAKEPSKKVIKLGASKKQLREVNEDDGDEEEIALGADGKGRKELDVRDKRWNGVKRAAEVEMGGLKPIHAGPETHNDIHHILRVFDLTSAYGPCVGITRLQRWERAKKWGLNPPDEIKEILTTRQGEDEAEFRENVLHTWLG